MAPPQRGDILVIPATRQKEAAIKVEWSQSWQTKQAKFYLQRAKNQSRGNEDVLLYAQDVALKEGTDEFIGNIPGARKEGDNWIVSIDDHFQYGQKNANGDCRFIVLQNKDNEMYQHRFLTTTLQGSGAAWARSFLGMHGGESLVDAVYKIGGSCFGDYLKTF